MFAGGWLESWCIDEDTFTYTRKNCLGMTALKVTGEINDGELVWTGIEDGLDPWPGDQDTPTTPFTMTSTKFSPAPIAAGTSPSDIDGERKSFIEMCIEDGQEIEGSSSGDAERGRERMTPEQRRLSGVLSCVT